MQSLKGGIDAYFVDENDDHPRPMLKCPDFAQYGIKKGTYHKLVSCFELHAAPVLDGEDDSIVDDADRFIPLTEAFNEFRQETMDPG